MIRCGPNSFRMPRNCMWVQDSFMLSVEEICSAMTFKDRRSGSIISQPMLLPLKHMSPPTKINLPNPSNNLLLDLTIWACSGIKALIWLLIMVKSLEHPLLSVMLKTDLWLVLNKVRLHIINPKNQNGKQNQLTLFLK